MKTEKQMNSESIRQQYRPRYMAQENILAERKMYQDQVKKLLRKGCIGFLIGFVLYLSMENDWQLAMLMGIFFTGIPHGWTILGNFFGHWLAFGTGAFMFLVYFLQFLGACIIGWLAYPTALLNALVKAQISGSVLQKVFQAVRLLWFGLLALIAAFMILTCFK